MEYMNKINLIELAIILQEEYFYQILTKKEVYKGIDPNLKINQLSQ